MAYQQISTWFNLYVDLHSYLDNIYIYYINNDKVTKFFEDLCILCHRQAVIYARAAELKSAAVEGDGLLPSWKIPRKNMDDLGVPP